MRYRRRTPTQRRPWRLRESRLFRALSSAGRWGGFCIGAAWLGYYCSRRNLCSFCTPADLFTMSMAQGRKLYWVRFVAGPPARLVFVLTYGRDVRDEVVVPVPAGANDTAMALVARYKREIIRRGPTLSRQPNPLPSRPARPAPHLPPHCQPTTQRSTCPPSTPTSCHPATPPSGCRACGSAARPPRNAMEQAPPCRGRPPRSSSGRSSRSP